MTNEERRKATEWFRNRAKNCPMQGARRMYEIATEALEERERNEQLHWIPVTERLPSKGTNVLVCEFGRVEQAYTTTYTADRSLCWVVINGGSYHRISDADCPIKWWMTLPRPPDHIGEATEMVEILDDEQYRVEQEELWDSIQKRSKSTGVNIHDLFEPPEN